MPTKLDTLYTLGITPDWTDNFDEVKYGKHPYINHTISPWTIKVINNN